MTISKVLGIIVGAILVWNAIAAVVLAYAMTFFEPITIPNALGIAALVLLWVVYSTIEREAILATLAKRACKEDRESDE